MLFKFGMTECKSVSTPLDRNVKFRPDFGPACDPKRFRQIVGSFIYLTITRSDLSYPVGLISQFMAHPIVEHRILRYVSCSKDKGLLYRPGVAEQLVGTTDADWARNVGDHRSTSRYAFSLGSVVVAWSSKKQPIVAPSSIEAEYRGAAGVTCEAIWLKRVLKDMQVELSNPMTIYYDNLSSIHLAKNPVFHARTKHIEVHYRFVRE